MNRGLILISPVILVRLLTTEEFGRYREFLLYAGLLASIASFGISSSLLRFIPDDPRNSWRYVDQAVLITFCTSLIAISGMLALDWIGGGRIVGEYAIPVALYVLFYVNIDFWEALYLAEKRGLAILRYTSVRLVARITVVTCTAALTRDVGAIITALIVLEAVRLVISAFAWRIKAGVGETKAPQRWREQVRYCLPFGMAMIMVTLNRSVGALFVAKMLGPVALAHYTIGTYLNPVVSVIRNSLSDVVLPEMSSLKKGAHADRLGLWSRTTVVTAILLIAAGVVLARFAEIVVITLFSEEFRPAVVLFQIYLLSFLRDCVDFSIPLRAMSRTASLFRSSLVAITVNAIMMLMLVPRWGTAGAVVAFVISGLVEGTYLARQTARAYQVPVRKLVPWLDLLKVLVAAALASALLWGKFWTEQLGLFGIAAGGAVYMVVFVFLLLRFQVPEAGLFLQWLRSMTRTALRRMP